MNVLPIIKAVLPVARNVVKRLVPDRDLSEKLEAEMARELLDAGLKEMQAAANNVLAEIQGESFLQRNWRPMVMLFFAGLIGAYWFGLTPDKIGENEIRWLIQMLTVGLGGYVLGRSGEKIAKNWKQGDR